MKYFNKMITSLLVQNDFIVPDERFEIEKDLEESSSKFDNSAIGGIVNTFMKSPIGVLIMLLIYAFAMKKFKQIRNDMDDDVENQEFKREMKRQAMRDLLK